MSVLQDCSKLIKAGSPSAAILYPSAQAELTAYYADWNNFTAGIGPDPGIMPADATVGYNAIWPIAFQTPSGSWSCVEETDVSDYDRQTILNMASMMAIGAMVGYLSKVPNPPQMQYWICDDGRKVPRGSGQGIDPDLAKCVACGGSAGQCGSVPSTSPNGSGSSPIVGISIAAAAAVALWWVINEIHSTV